MSGGYGLAVVPQAERGELVTAVRVRMSAAMVRHIQQIATETGRSNADVARFLIAAGIEAYEKEKSRGKK